MTCGFILTSYLLLDAVDLVSVMCAAGAGCAEHREVHTHSETASVTSHSLKRGQETG